MKASRDQIIKAYTDSVKLCLDKIFEVNEIHKDQSGESQAYETKKVIDKWFLRGGRLD